MEEVTNAKDLLEETVDVLREKKTASKALTEVNKRVLQETGGDKADWRIVTKVNSNKGRAWIDDNPLELNTEEKHKDFLSSIFIKLVGIIKATESFNLTDDLLSEYFEKLEEIGIKITVDSDKFDHLSTEGLDTDIHEELDSVKSYDRTIENYNDEIREEHVVKAEELDFSPADTYMKVVNIYRKGLSGKEIDDDVQNILTHNEMFDSAVNLTADYVKNLG